jgi:glycosyltransferase involved in cell wall biosynthesis
MTPRLSVITSCYNHGRYLRECIDSVRRQTVWDIEHIIVIDGATDNSLAIADEAMDADDRTFVIVNRANRGLAASQNRGISVAQAPWLLKVDADDYIAPTYVADILDAAEADPRRNVIFSPAQHVGHRQDVFRYPSFNPARMIDTLMLAGCAAIRRDLWDAVGGHDETLRFAEDWDLYIRAHLAVGLVPHQLRAARWFYRVHDGPRASAEGTKHIAELRDYWRGHTRETALGRTRTWAQWQAERQAA